MGRRRSVGRNITEVREPISEPTAMKAATTLQSDSASDHPQQTPGRAWSRAVPLVAAIAALLYAGGHLAWYRTTPLGQVPVMDEQENLLLAEALFRGNLPTEPFYRAMGYPLLLAVLRACGVSAPALFSAALVLGVVCHAVNAALAARVAHLWFGRLAGCATGVLYALNPVLVHYATQALDATPALTFFLLGLAVLASGFLRPPQPSRIGDASSASALAPPAKPAPSRLRIPDSGFPFHASAWIVASLAWAIATAIRPNYLLAWLVLPILAAALRSPRPKALRALAAATGAIVFVALAAWQWRVSGVVGVLPWQGAYNLWAANGPGAHGRYFVQRAQVPTSQATLNPTRDESVFLYQQETGHAPASISALNTHWRQRFIEYVTSHPIEWFGLLVRKSYALFNDWEQYNNKTYAFHQARSPWLRWNPLSWGVLIVLSALGAARLIRERRGVAKFTGAVAAALAIGVLLFFVSARFRLPLAALVAILAGGAFGVPRSWRSWPSRARLTTAVALAGVAVLTFSRFDGVRDRRTFVEDHALLARAAERTGAFELAWAEANAALALNPQHPDALRVAVIVYFNLLVMGHEAPAPEIRWLDLARQFLTSAKDDAPELQAIDRTVSPTGLSGAPLEAWDEPLVRLAGASLEIAPPSGVSPGDPRRAAEVLQRIFAPTAKP